MRSNRLAQTRQLMELRDNSLDADNTNDGISFTQEDGLAGDVSWANSSPIRGTSSRNKMNTLSKDDENEHFSKRGRAPKMRIMKSIKVSSSPNTSKIYDIVDQNEQNINIETNTTTTLTTIDNNLNLNNANNDIDRNRSKNIIINKSALSKTEINLDFSVSSPSTILSTHTGTATVTTLLEDTQTEVEADCEGAGKHGQLMMTAESQISMYATDVNSNNNNINNNNIDNYNHDIGSGNSCRRYGGIQSQSQHKRLSALPVSVPAHESVEVPKSIPTTLTTIAAATTITTATTATTTGRGNTESELSEIDFALLEELEREASRTVASQRSQPQSHPCTSSSQMYAQGNGHHNDITKINGEHLTTEFSSTNSWRDTESSKQGKDLTHYHHQQQKQHHLQQQQTGWIVSGVVDDHLSTHNNSKRARLEGGNEDELRVQNKETRTDTNNTLNAATALDDTATNYNANTYIHNQINTDGAMAADNFGDCDIFEGLTEADLSFLAAGGNKQQQLEKKESPKVQSNADIAHSISDTQNNGLTISETTSTSSMNVPVTDITTHNVSLEDNISIDEMALFDAMETAARNNSTVIAINSSISINNSNSHSNKIHEGCNNSISVDNFCVDQMNVLDDMEAAAHIACNENRASYCTSNDDTCSNRRDDSNSDNNNYGSISNSSSSRSSASSSSTAVAAVQDVDISFCQRYIVLECTEVEGKWKYVACFAPSHTETDSLRMTSNRKTLLLSGEWYHTPLEAGDILQVLDFCDSSLSHLSPFKVNSSEMPGVDIVVDDQRGFLIIHPDILVSPTRISESVSCSRRGVVSERVRNIGSYSAPAVMGNLKHEFAEALLEIAFAADRDALRRVPFSPQEIKHQMHKVIANHVDNLHACCVDDSIAVEQLQGIVRSLEEWIKQVSNIHANQSNAMHVDSVVGLEENIWCPSLGIKGQIDVVVMCSLAPASLTNSKPNEVVPVPVELKTGRWRQGTQAAHNAQVMLYVLMLAIRQKQMQRLKMNLNKDSNYSHHSSYTIPSYGVLFYLGTNDTESHVETIQPRWVEIRSLICSRNRFAYYVKRSQNRLVHPLPTLLKNIRECENCYQAAECMLYHATVENGDTSSSGTRRLYNMVNRNLNSEHKAYFKHWDRLLDLEACEGDNQCFMWTTSSSMREARGDSCLGRFTTITWEPTSDGLHWKVKLQRDGMLRRQQALTGNVDAIGAEEVDDSDAILRLNKGDRVSVSIEALTPKDKGISLLQVQSTTGKGQGIRDLEDLIQIDDISKKNDLEMVWDISSVEPNICNGNIEAINSNEVVILLRKLPKRMEFYLQLFNETCRQGMTNSTATTGPTHIQRTFSMEQFGLGTREISIRLDKDETSNGISGLRANLMKLFITAHNPKGMKEILQSLSKESLKAIEQNPYSCRIVSESLGADVSSTGHLRLRELIVDLLPPVFVNNLPHIVTSVATSDVKMSSDSTDSSNNNSDGRVDPALHMFKPSGVPTASYDSSLFLLRQHINGTSPPPNKDIGINSHPSPSPSPSLIYSSMLPFWKGCLPSELLSYYRECNSGQREALHRVLSAEDYVLLLGMPGTGKTSVLSLIIRALVARGKRVLVTSYTHSAVDTVLLKLKQAGVKSDICARLGSLSAIHDDCQDYILDASAFTSVTDLQQRLDQVRVVCCTVLTAARHPLLSRLKTDWCIVDEAGQVNQPAVIGALLCSKRFVLVGDDYQLPPLVVSPEARAGGMDVSLFKRLAEAHPQAVTSLNEQYRMNDQIMLVCNTLIYEHRLSCGSQSVANARLHLTKEITSLPYQDWLTTCIDPSKSVTFIDTDRLAGGNSERSNSNNGSHSNGSLVNLKEVNIVCTIMEGLSQCGVDVGNVGVVSPYRSQVRELKRALERLPMSLTRSSLGSQTPSFDVSTVDRFQGRDVDVMIMSFVRSNAEGSVGDLLRDWRRINVAVSRAKRKLLFIGSSSTLRSTPLLAGLLELMEEKKWMLKLPQDALENYQHKK